MPSFSFGTLVPLRGQANLPAAPAPSDFADLAENCTLDTKNVSKMTPRDVL